MATTQLETERTFEVPRRWSFPAVVGVGAVASVAGPRRFTQAATYLDTPRLDLLRAKRTLRRRTGGIDAGWHLKLPKGADTRTEVHEPLGSSAARVPAALRDLVADVVGVAPLLPVCVLRTRRTRRELLDASGALVAEVVDDAVEASVLVDGEHVVRWREVELELGPAGTADDLDALTAVLVESRLVPSDSPSKLGRALAGPLAALQTPAPRSAGALVTDYLGTQLGVVQALESAVREDAPDAVHKVRVATRRARSALKTYRRLYDPTVVDDLRGELAWLAGLLGGPRDAEVLLARLTVAVDSLEPELVVGPVARRIATMLEGEHAAGRTALLAALDGRRYERLLADLSEVVAHPPYLGTDAADLTGAVIAELTGKAATRVETAARAAHVADGAERDVVIHEIRKKAKAARYAGEVAAGLGPQATAQWTALQEALGDYQDGVVAVEALRRAAAQAHAAGEQTFSYGVLVERELAAQRAIRRQYGDLLDAALKPAKGSRRGARRQAKR